MKFDYRKFLIEELERRESKNPSYSLRSFARDLKVSPSKLSEIINKKKGTSISAGKKMVQSLGLNSFEGEKFLLSIQYLHSKSQKKKESAYEKLKEYSKQSETELTLEAFNVISQWYHYSILEVIGSDLDIQSIEGVAKFLGIKKNIVSQAIKRLETLSLIKKSNHFYVVNANKRVTPFDVPSDALKNHHEQVLDLSKKALWEQDVNEREFGSTTMAFNSSKLDEAKEIIRECRRKLSDLADNSNNRKSIYILGTQFFKVNKELV